MRLVWIFAFILAYKEFCKNCGHIFEQRTWTIVSISTYRNRMRLVSRHFNMHTIFFGDCKIEKLYELLVQELQYLWKKIIHCTPKRVKTVIPRKCSIYGPAALLIMDFYFFARQWLLNLTDEYWTNDTLSFKTVNNRTLLYTSLILS